jgi:hypothetical protein
VISVLEDAILATDLALFYKRRDETLARVREGIDWQVRAESFIRYLSLRSFKRIV